MNPNPHPNPDPNPDPNPNPNPSPNPNQVGTAFARPDEPEPTSGRLLIFSVTERTLELKHELSTAGAVYALEAFNGKLLAGVNNKLQLYEWMPCARAPRLQLRHEHCGHILVLYVQVHRHGQYSRAES